MVTYGSLSVNEKQKIREKIIQLYDLEELNSNLMRRLFKETGVTISYDALNNIIWDYWIIRFIKPRKPITRCGRPIVF